VIVPLVLAIAFLTACASPGGISASSSGGTFTPASAEGPAQIEYRPASGKGTPVLVLSGYDSVARYGGFAGQLAQVGHYAVLFDGRDMLNEEGSGATNFRSALERVLGSPHAASTRAAVVGFSLGGGAALMHGTHNTERVSSVVAYYPTTAWIKSPDQLSSRVRVPTLVLAAGQDRKSCCRPETIRAVAKLAKLEGAPFTLVEYPWAGHGFAFEGATYSGADTTDAWRRTTSMIAAHSRD
jgi:pimeloyl-ACP methyl ester carboxylesterase